MKAYQNTPIFLKQSDLKILILPQFLIFLTPHSQRTASSAFIALGGSHDQGYNVQTRGSPQQQQSLSLTTSKVVRNMKVIQNPLPLLTVSWQDKHLLRFDFTKLTVFLSCGSLCMAPSSVGHRGWVLRLPPCLTSRSLLHCSPSLLPSHLTAAPLPCSAGSNSYPFLAHGFPHLLLEKEQALNKRKTKVTQLFTHMPNKTFLSGTLNYLITRLQ